MEILIEDHPSVTKKCIKCCEEKLLSEFPKDGEYVRPMCKLCKNAYQREHLKSDPTYRKNRQNSNNRSALKNIINELQRKARTRARASNLPYEENFLKKIYKELPATCPVLGIPIACNAGNGVVSSNSPSVDRIDPRKGYTSDNVRIISYRANMLKNNGTIEEFKKILADLLEIRGTEKSVDSSKESS